MRLHELKILKQSDSTFNQALADFVEKHGFQHEFGGNANVLISSSGYAWRTWLNDKGFETYLAYVMANPGKHVIKLLSKVREEEADFKKLPKGMTLKFVKVEKLDPIPATHELYDVLDILDDNMGRKHVYESLESFKAFVQVRLHEEYEDAIEKILAAIEKYESFFEVYIDLARRGANDMTVFNVMMRGDVLVFTDPFSS